MTIAKFEKIAAPGDSPRKGISQRVGDQIEDPWNLYVEAPATDDSVPVATRISKKMKQQVAQFVQRGDTRFLTDSDVFRAAISWFMLEKSRSLGITDTDVKLLTNEIRDMQIKARAGDFKRFCDAARDLFLKMKLGAPQYVVELWHSRLKVARDISPDFGQNYKAWAKLDPALEGVRELVREQARAEAEAQEEE